MQYLTISTMYEDRRKKKRRTCYCCGIGHVLCGHHSLWLFAGAFRRHRSEVVGVGLALDAAGVCRHLLLSVGRPSSVVVCLSVVECL